MGKQDISVVSNTAGLPSHDLRLSDDAQAAIKNALSTNTRRAYAAQLKLWEEHCHGIGAEPYPASPVAVTNWIAGRITRGSPGRRRANAGRGGQTLATARVAIAALAWAHTARGLDFDSRDRLLVKALQGLRSNKAEPTIQSRALSGLQLVAIIEGMGDDLTSLRDAALLALGFSAARRRSEITGLDLDIHGGGDGILERSPSEFRVVLLRGKTVVAGDDDPIFVNRHDNPLAAQALDRWIKAGSIKPGTPVFRRIRAGSVLEHRMPPDYVARIVKMRIKDHLVATGADIEVAESEARAYAGHSLRHGFASSAAEAGASTLEIASVTGHRSQQILARYVRQADKNKLRPGKRAGVGLRKANLAPDG